MDSKDIKSMKKSIYSEMLATRGWKYRWFLTMLRSYKYFSMSPTRGKLLEGFYILARHVDDTVDGDAPLPSGYTSSVEYINKKIEFAKHPSEPKDTVDYLLVHCFKLADKLDFKISEEVQDIFTSMRFDAKRAGKRIIFPEKELKHHFYLLDIRGTIKGTLKVFGSDPEKYKVLEPLGVATRIYMDLRDYDDDIKAGLINVSKEDCERFNITNLEDRLSPGVQDWFKAKATEGLELLEESKELVSKADFNPIWKMALPLTYGLPAKKIFNKVLA